MSNLLITGITLHNQWKINMIDPLTWEAWIVDARDAETGAPLLMDIGFEPLVEQIKVYEAGMKGEPR